MAKYANENAIDMVETGGVQSVQESEDKMKDDESERQHQTLKDPNLGKPWVDRGWAWVTVTAGFLTLFIAIGQMRCIGIYFAELQSLFPGKSTLTAAMPSIIYIMTPFISLPSSILTTCYGSRPVVIAAILLIAFAQASTIFATNIVHILIFYSIPFGIGSGLGYTSAILLVSKYFAKHRSLAQGIMLTGFSLTGITFPAIYSPIEEEFGYRGAMMLIGGILLHAVIPACLLRSPEFWEKYYNKKSSNSKTENKQMNNEMKPLATQEKSATSDNDNSEDVSDNLVQQKFALDSSSGSMVVLGTIISASQQELRDLKKSSFNSENNTQGCFSGSKRTLFKESWEKLRKTIHWPLLKNYAFLTHMLVALCGFIGFQMTFTILPSHARDKGYSTAESYYLITAASFGELPSRIVIPFLADRWSSLRFGNRFHVMSLCLIISGVCAFLMAYASTYTELVVYATCIGVFCGGGFLALNVDVLRDAIGLEKLANGGLGLNLFFNGLTMSAMMMVLGHLRDRLDSYEVPFITIGCITIFGGVFTWLQPLAQRLEAKKAK